MSIDPKEYSPNEAWLLFQLNDAPVRTEADGDFNVLAVMDVATGLILGIEFIGSLENEPSEFESRRDTASGQYLGGYSTSIWDRSSGCLSRISIRRLWWFLSGLEMRTKIAGKR